MAAATSTLTVNAWPNGVDNTQTRQRLNGICALSAGGTYLTNGIPTNWGALVDGNTGGTFIPETTKAQPLVAFFSSQAGGTYQYLYDPVHNTLRIYQAGVELANAAAITADTIGFQAEYARGV